jgi:hypothetical protein
MPSAIGRSNRLLGQVGRREADGHALVARKLEPARLQRGPDALARLLDPGVGEADEVKLGRPLARWTSTLTAGDSRPRSARLRTMAKLMPTILRGDASGTLAQKRARDERRASDWCPRHAGNGLRALQRGADARSRGFGTQRAKRRPDLNNSSGNLR